MQEFSNKYQSFFFVKLKETDSETPIQLSDV
jgi:hypothetical protein